MYVNKLPYKERSRLCDILDDNDNWKKLAGLYMGYNDLTIRELERKSSRGKSATDALLALWGVHNHTVLELFCLLFRLSDAEAMGAILEFVGGKYHVYVHLAKENLKQVCKHEKEKADLGMSTMSSVRESAGTIPLASYEELRSATNDWDESVVLGKGGFGTVFKAEWKRTQVAIKRIERRENGTAEAYSEQINQSVTELQCLNAFRHDNILSLYGYSVGGPQPCLIYQYMTGGSLDQRLRPKTPEQVLSWPKRLNIAIGAARGLQFLHTVGETPLIHGDIKPANILLDANDQAKIGDFGLAREGPSPDGADVHLRKINGTRFYLPLDFIRSGKLSTKVDTFSFGVVLLEIGAGLRWYEGQLSYLKRFENWGHFFAGFVGVGKLCIKGRSDDRPEMEEVLGLLEAMDIYRCPLE